MHEGRQKNSEFGICEVLLVVMTSVGSSAIHRTAATRPAFINVFMIIGEVDSPLLFVDLSSDGVRDDSPHLDEFIIHSSLDSIDSLRVHTPDSFLRSADKFNDFQVAAYAGAGDIKMVLLHKNTHDESIRLFFQVRIGNVIP